MNKKRAKKLFRAICFEIVLCLLFSIAGLYLIRNRAQAPPAEPEEETAQVEDETEEEEDGLPLEPEDGAAGELEDDGIDTAEDGAATTDGQAALTDGELQADQYTCKGQITRVLEDGSLLTNISPAQLSAYGIGQNDLVNVTIGKRNFILPVETEVKLVTFWGRTRLALDTERNAMTIVRDYQDFAMMEGYTEQNVGDEVDIWLLETDAYQMKMQEPLGLTETVANFRNVQTGDLGRGILYRSHSPIDPQYSNARCQCADNLAWDNAITTVINLNQNMDEVEEDVHVQCPESYYRYLFDQGDVSGIRIDGKRSFDRPFMDAIATHMRFIISHEAPYMIHCRMGKDRAGFVIAVLEALEGTTYQEIGEEYAKTFRNYYGVEEGSWMDKYNQSDGANTFLQMMQVGDTTPYESDDGTQMRKIARNYLSRIGLSSVEIDQLQAKLAMDLPENWVSMRHQQILQEKYFAFNKLGFARLEDSLQPDWKEIKLRHTIMARVWKRKDRMDFTA